MALRVRTDWTLYVVVLVMIGFGLLMVMSASSVAAEMHYKVKSYHFFQRQVVAALLGFFLFMHLTKFDYRRLYSPSWIFVATGVVVALLVVVLIVDPNKHRFIRLGFVQFQPSEFVKPVLIVFMAYMLTFKSTRINDRSTIIMGSLVLGAMGGLVAVGDYGTALVLGVTTMVMFFVAGLNKKYLILAMLAGVVASAVVILTEPYRLKRLVEWLVSGLTNYQAEQSLIGIGAGGLVGAGLMDSIQKLLFLPEAHTDFIFAIVGEEFGLIGTAGVLILYFVILQKGLRLFWTAPDNFGRYIALGVVVSLFFQAMVHISVGLNLAPTKGIPLPMISYGGSSMVGSLIMLGLLSSVSQRRVEARG